MRTNFRGLFVEILAEGLHLIGAYPHRRILEFHQLSFRDVEVIS